MPKVSVIMSIYNEPIGWIRQSVQSILCQSYNNFEFIIVNDNPGREDNEVLLREIRNADKRVVTLSNQINIGLTKSLNRALSIARGEYIARMDADDMSLPQRFEKQVCYLDSHPEIVALGSWTGMIDERGCRLPGISRYEVDPKWLRALIIQNSQVAHPASMFRRLINDHTVCYDETVKYAQDYSLWVSLLHFGEITNLPEVLFCYRNSDNQITRAKLTEQQECAKYAQRRAFAMFGMPASQSFLDTFSDLTIRHRNDISLDRVEKDFRLFFKEVQYGKTDSLVLEIICSSYLSYLIDNQKNMFNAIIGVFSHSSLRILLLGMKFCVHCFFKKLNKVNA